MSILSGFFNKKSTPETAVAIKQASGVELSNESMRSALKSTEALAVSVLNGIQTLSKVISSSQLQEEQINRFDVLIKETNQSLNGLYSITEEMKKFADTQTNSVAKSLVSMENLSSTITSVSSDIKERLAITQGLSQAAVEGNEKVKKILDMVKVLSDNMESIKTVIGSINSISAQTNMLAMNAAIEAAHAGQAGRGFSVVADEIRKLSEVTRGNAVNITGTVKNTMGSLEEVRGTVNKASETMVWIEEEVMKAASSFNAITQNMQKLDEESGNMSKIVQTVDSSGGDLKKQSEETYNSLKNVGEALKNLVSLEGQIKDNSSLITFSSTNLTGFFVDLLDIDSSLQSVFDTALKDTQTPFSKEPFTLMAIKHIIWVANVRRFIDGKFDKRMELSIEHRSCEIGKWLGTQGQGQKDYKLAPAFQSLVRSHEELHDLVKDFVAKKDSFNFEERETKYADILKALERVVDSLTKLRNS
jgi:methyl-accepting chemotaxis protein